ncbi:MAG: MFS transporter [Gammaproteobacteria bacterium]
MSLRKLPFDSRSPEALLILLAAAVALGFSIWRALLNNFAVEQVAFTGVEIGILQSLREVPGFLAFTTVFVLLVLKEQTFILISTALLGLGVALTGFLPSEYGLYFTTILMSVGFHYFFTVQQSLTLQWISKERAPEAMGLQSAAGSIASIVAFAFIWVAMEWGSVSYTLVYLLGGLVTLLAVFIAATRFPHFKEAVPQRKHLVLRRRYWLFYALTFMGGARRQIFVVFAGFLMVEKFGYSAADIALLFLINHIINAWFAPRIGRFIGHFGERQALTLEYIGLIFVFLAYAVVDVAWVAGALYVLDHLLFAMAISIRSYFQKIADPADIASTSGVSFSINHIAAVVIPVVFGFIWIQSHAAVFIAGAGMAVISLILARLVPEDPSEGNEVQMGTPVVTRATG